MGTIRILTGVVRQNWNRLASPSRCQDDYPDGFEFEWEAIYLILLFNYTVGSIPQVFLRRYSTSIPVLGAMEDLIAKIPLRSLFSKVRGLRVRVKKEEVIWCFFFLGLLFCLVRLFATPSSLWDLVPQPRIEPVPLAVKVRSPNRRTTREFPYLVILNSFVEI